MNPVSPESAYRVRPHSPSIVRHLMRVFVKSFTEKSQFLLTFVKSHELHDPQGAAIVKICELPRFLWGVCPRVL